MSILKREILIVEANLQARKSIEAMLKQQGYSCSFANDGFQAFDMVAKYPYDLVITELNLPHMIGTDFIKRFKTAEGTRMIPMIVASDRSDKSIIEKCFGYGAADYVIKPIDAKVLIQKIERILGGRPRFAEVPMEKGDTGYSEVVFSSHLVSIGETGLVMWSPIPLDEETAHRVRAKVFAVIGIHSPVLKVAHCEPQPDGGYNVYFSFSNMKESDLKTVRTWVIEKHLKEASA